MPSIGGADKKFMELDAIRSHFIEKNVTRIKNANETSEGRAKHIYRRFESNKVQPVRSSLLVSLRQSPEHVGPFVSGSFHEGMSTSLFSAVLNVEHAW